MVSSAWISPLITNTWSLLVMMSLKPSLFGIGPMKKKKDLLSHSNLNIQLSSKINTGLNSILKIQLSWLLMVNIEFFSLIGSKACLSSNTTLQESKRKILVKIKLYSLKLFSFQIHSWLLQEPILVKFWCGTNH
jgi:hypothetical protein